MSWPALTRVEILQLPAGHDLDGLVAKHVLGCDVRTSNIGPNRFYYCCCPEGSHTHYRECGAFVAAYSHDMGRAWQVVEKIVQQGTLISIAVGPYGDQGVKTSVMVFGMDGGVADASAPLAICRAALLAQLWQQESFPP